MKKFISIVLLLVMISSVFSFVSCGDKKPVIYVLNMGEYISDGSDDSLDVIAEFEKKYNVTVKYDTIPTNEELYIKIKNGASYDVIITSDYMVSRLINENLVQKIDIENNITNYKNIDEKYKNQYFDTNNEYSVPYFVGMVGILYNKTMVSKEDAEKQSWSLLWNSNYKNDIITFNNPRDAFGTAILYQGNSVNSNNEKVWNDAYDLLLKQKRDVNIAYLNDEIYNKMENDNAAVATYYAGDCMRMMQVNENLDFYYPIEGTNIFVDSMCVPTAAKNKTLGEQFINFMLETDIAVANANYVCYASPNKTVWEDADYDYKKGTDGYRILYETPAEYVTNPEQTQQYYHDLSTECPEIQKLMSSLFTELKLAK